MHFCSFLQKPFGKCSYIHIMHVLELLLKAELCSNHRNSTKLAHISQKCDYFLFLYSLLILKLLQRCEAAWLNLQTKLLMMIR